MKGLLWQFMRFHMLQLLKSLRSRTQGKDMTDADILSWANRKVRTRVYPTGCSSSTFYGLLSHELLTGILSPRVKQILAKFSENQNQSLLLKRADEEKRLNATYIVSVARKLGCSVFLLPEDIVEVKHKMILILTASIMYWSLQKRSTESSDSSSSQSTTTSTDASPAPSVTGEDEVSSLSGEVSSLAVDDSEADAVSDITTVSEETPNELIDCQREFARETTILLREQRSLVIILTYSEICICFLYVLPLQINEKRDVYKIRFPATCRQLLVMSKENKMLDLRVCMYLV
ncbi:hypothetical protein Bca52824_021496 [Brassica carinata]|uniref:Calponin-homology (CH) domain-containing protein n=1 Tax=Brassica carinata TaxID=52824 RepID=A0A8X8APY4_BRACI|nr:hypothetical protein Bca52824_021496 [Brassica carinata]